MSVLRALLLVLACALPPALASANKPRVASINMCTDQLVLALADDAQILGLSALSRDATLSYYRARALRFPVLSGLAEDALLLRPELIVTASFAKPETRAMLTRSGLRVEAFGDARTIAEVKAQIARMGALLDQSERADAALRAIDDALAALATPAEVAPLSVLPLERRGWITGKDTLLTEMLRAAGFRNLGADLVEYGGRLPLERIVGLVPDRLLLTTADPHAEDQGSALLQHPALHRLRARGVLVLPESLTVCAGPMLAEALQRLNDARQAR